MFGKEFATEAGVNNFLFVDNPVDAATSTALYTDKIYGLNNVNNYGRWAPLCPDADP